MFRIFTGSYRALEQAFTTELQTIRNQNPISSLLVISPSGHILTQLQRKLAEQTPSMLNVQFLTFYALAERVLADAEYTEGIVTESGVYQEIIRQILVGENPEAVDLEIRKALRVEGQIVPKGLAGALAATMKDLRDSGMRADRALQAAKEGFLGQEAPEAAATLALYARLVGLFEKKNLRSSADLLRRAATRVPRHPWIKQQKAIFLYGFYDLTGVQLDLVMSLADHPNARLYFPFEEGNPAFAYAEKLLKDPALTSKILVDRPLPNAGEGGGEGAAKTLIPSPGRLRRTTSPARGEVSSSVWSCSGPRDEVWLTAKEILKLVDDGVPFGEIAVISRNVGAYLPALREIFTAHAIPYLCAKNEPAGSHPLVKTIRTLVTLDDTNPHAKTLRKDLEKSPYTVTSSPAAVGRGSIMDSPPMAAGNDVLEAWSAHIFRTTELIKTTIRLPKDPSPEESALLEAILSSLESLKILDALDQPVTREHFLDVWQDKLDALERPGPEIRHDGVQVLDVQEARGLPFRAVFVLGMNEKVFPRLIREDPFFSDAARSSLAQATGCRLGRKMDGYEEEKLLFELTRQAASDYLYLLTQRSDSEGKALIPSVYLEEKPQRLPRSIAEKFEGRSPLLWTPRELSFLINRAQLDPKAVYQAMGWNAAAYYKTLAAHRAMESFKPGLGPYDGQVEDPKALQGTISKPFSPSSLEMLAQCPFQYYADHVLRVAPEEELAQEGEMTHKALGQLFHKALELFYTSCRDQGLPVDSEALATRLKGSIDMCFDQNKEALSSVYPLVITSSKQVIFKELLAFIKSDLEESSASGFRPTWFEQPLEGTLPLAGLSHRFYGKPDRLDIQEAEGPPGVWRVRVVDYKSGKARASSGRIETHLIQGKFLQLPIYLGLAGGFASKTLGKPVIASEATLRPVREPDDEGKVRTLASDFWESPSATLFAENINELIKLIEKGSFYIEPDSGDWGYCDKCDFALICRKEHMPSRLRAERDATRRRVSEKLSRTAPRDEGRKEKTKELITDH